MPTTGPDIVLKLVVLDSEGNFFGDRVDFQFKHRTLNLSGGQKGLDASQEINISGLRRAPEGDYQVTVTPSGSFHPQSQFVSIPATGFTTAKFVFQKPRPIESQPLQPPAQPSTPAQPQPTTPSVPLQPSADDSATPNVRANGGGDDQDVVLKIRVLNPQRDFLGGIVDIEFRPNTGFGATTRLSNLSASEEINVRGLRQFPPPQVYVVTVLRTGTDQFQSHLATIVPGNVAVLEYIFGDDNGNNPPPDQTGTIFVEVQTTNGEFLGGLADVSVKNTTTGVVSENQSADASSAISFSNLPARDNYEVTVKPESSPAQTQSVSIPVGALEATVTFFFETEGDDQALLKIRVLDLQGDFLGGTVDLELKPNDGIGDTLRQSNVPASQEIDVKGLEQFPSTVYVVTVTVTGTDQLQSQFATIQPGNVVVLEYRFGDNSGGNPDQNGTIVVQVLNSTGDFLGGMADISAKNVATGEISQRNGADASNGIVVGGLRPQPQGNYEVTAKPQSAPAQTKTVSLPATTEPSATVAFFFSTPAPPQPPSGTGAGTGAIGRRVLKATHVPLKLEAPPSDNGGSILKFGYLGQLRLQSGEVDTVRANMPEMSDALANSLRSLEGSPTASQLPSPTVFMKVPSETLLTFGKKIMGLRQAAVDNQGTHLASGAAALTPFAVVSPSPGVLTDLNNAAISAVNWFEMRVALTPIGILNLERLEMTPVGIQRGELLATIPLAPLEQTAVVHKEWSVTTKEFQTIVTDSLENYSETGVTDNTELAQATTSQASHSNQFNVNGTMTASYGNIFTGSVSSGFQAQDQHSDSASESRKHAITTTRKASSRVKQEHKVTISTTTVTGTSETSTRILQNPSPTDPIRIDYFSMMRKWHVGLYRYGLRLTYDVAIPEPAAALRQSYAVLAGLRSQIGPFSFNVPHFRPGFVKSKSDPHYEQVLSLADQYNAQVPPFPEAEGPVVVGTFLQNDTDANSIRDEILPAIDVPDGFCIEHLFISIRLRNVGAAIRVLFSDYPEKKCDDPAGNNFGPDDLTLFGFGNAATGKLEVRVSHHDCQNSGVLLEAMFSPTNESIDSWLAAVWSALYDAAQAQYYTEQQDIAVQISAIEDQLSNVDTLTLRREENEEIMKAVLRWILGPSFDFMPPDVLQLFKDQKADLAHGTVPPSDVNSGGGLAAAVKGWSPMFLYEEMVKFINEAIEWENVVYFLYSYFWDVQPSWDFIRQIRHLDPTRQAFLRAGSARVVLTVRKGWEEAWVTFVEAGGFQAALIPGHPYLDIATEIALYDRTNYPGIPPANPGGGPLPDDGAYASTVCRGSLTPSGANAVSIEVDSSEGFRVGYTAIIDTWDSGVQEAQTITALPPDGKHITVDHLEKVHNSPPQSTPIPIFQGGEKGQLIAEWFEYTPTSGTDIAVTSNLATIS